MRSDPIWRPPAHRRGTDPDTAAAIDEAIDASFVTGFRVAMVIGAAMALLGSGRGVAAGRRKTAKPDLTVVQAGR